MLNVLRVHLPSEIPVVGCEITPYVLILKRPENSVSSDDVPESSPVNGCCMQYRWYRNQNDQKVAVCSVHPTSHATLQCLACIKYNVAAPKSFHCTPNCFTDAWQHHRVLHDQAKAAEKYRSVAEESRLNSGGSTSNTGESIGSKTVVDKSGETWFEIGRSRTYTPTTDDIGHILKFECTAIDATSRAPVGNLNTVLTSRVIPAPSPAPRRMMQVGFDARGQFDPDGQSAFSGTFSVLSYNILSDVCASKEQHSYCPSWALSWPYRRQNLLREIIGYRADIVCLQEVEFKKAANSVIESVVPATQKKAASHRLAKDNIALIVVLEAKFNSNGSENSGKRQVLCVANTHINVEEDHVDVKLWQVHTLVKGLEKIAASGDIALLVCGDLNTVPGSVPHVYLARGKIDHLRPEAVFDPLGVVHPLSKFNHQLPLVSAYSSFLRTVGYNQSLEQQKRRMDPATNEPLFTNFTRDFIGTHDYIFYAADRLTVESLLELLDEESLRKDTALPSAEWSSDHIALLAHFRCKPKIRN
ncbi:carbon catabolite repressor protein 4 homolog 1-like isoform X4 [Ananas comosus]|uniref:poly(A)-specific ribonuclease n=1 Tax=Ananas comosus TaxID=4615 RepID=A0A6P5ETG0_ANACO|nr:carbon catabolite repressor protein 4 homolog 1-like isoform X4 [Ananas comosus]